MIEISLYTALAFYGSIVIFGTLGMWFYTELTAQRVHRVLENQFLWRCSICAYTYLDEEAGEYSTCPRCGSINRIDDAGVKPYAVKPVESSLDRGEGRRNTSKKKRPTARSRGPRR